MTNLIPVIVPLVSCCLSWYWSFPIWRRSFQYFWGGASWTSSTRIFTILSGRMFWPAGNQGRWPGFRKSTKSTQVVFQNHIIFCQIHKLHNLIIPFYRDSTVPTKSAKELFGELGEGQLEALVEVYKEDFDIHAYNPYSVLYWICFFHCLTNVRGFCPWFGHCLNCKNPLSHLLLCFCLPKENLFDLKLDWLHLLSATIIFQNTGVFILMGTLNVFSSLFHFSVCNISCIYIFEPHAQYQMHYIYETGGGGACTWQCSGPGNRWRFCIPTPSQVPWPTC